MVRQAVPLQSMEVHSGADTPLQPGEDPTQEKMNAPKEAVTPWGAHTGAGSWQHLWPCGERGAHAGAGLLLGLVTTQGTYIGAVSS